MTMSTARRLTDAGIEEAQRFLQGLRDSPAGPRQPSDELLFGALSEPFHATVEVEPRTFASRAQAGRYLTERLGHLSAGELVSDAGLWSWLGMYYFAHIVRVEDGRVQLHADETSLFLGGRAEQRRYRHYLWAAWRAWRLHEQHGAAVSYFLDQPVTDSGDIAKALLDYPRVYTSVGVVPLILRLYTDGDRTKRGFSTRTRPSRGTRARPGNVWHLIERVLPQLELTYDVYGMEPEALLEILPPIFRQWDEAGVGGVPSN